MKRCWDHDPENRPTAKEIKDCLGGYSYGPIEEKKKSSNWQKPKDKKSSNQKSTCWIQRIINTVQNHSIQVVY